MNRLFDPEGPLMTLLGKFANLIFINIFWLICSLPVVTIGAATTAMYSVCFKIVNNKSVSIIKDYFKSFKENLKQATVIWGLLLIAGVLVGYVIYLAIGQSLSGSTVGFVSLIIYVLISVVLVSMLTYAFAVLAYFDNSIMETLKNAAILGISYSGYTILMVVCNVLLAVLGVLYCPFAIPVTPVLINTLLLNRIFRKHTPVEETSTDEISL